MAGAGAVLGVAGLAGAADLGGFFDAQVGQTTANGIVLPVNQTVKPVGSRAFVVNGRMISSTVSPDGTKVAALSWRDFTGFLSIVDLPAHRTVQQIGTGTKADPQLGDGTVAADAPLYSPDGRTLWVPQSTDIVRFAVDPAGRVSAPTIIKLPSTKGAALPSGLALSVDGQKLYAALNGNNTLGVIDTATDALTREIPVGNAPRQVAIVGGEAFVSNEGGRPATTGDFTNLSFNTPIVADPQTAAATTGTLSVVDLTTQTQTATIPVGLQPTALYVTGPTLMVANSNDDSVSIVDTATRHVTQTFNVNPLPGSTVGSAPNAITMPDPRHILVSLGRDNALAVYAYDGPASPVRYQGLLPTDWYPVNVQMTRALGGAVVMTNDWEHLLATQPTPPPSPIKHVFLIVKENRTYDQVLGDTARGNNDPSLTQFGAQVTPNAHALTNGFVQFDNFYDPGTLSADGHNWLMQADANDYIEKEFGAFVRSYPASGADALAYQRNGFLWNAAARAGKTVADFAEYANFFDLPSHGAPTWRQWYRHSLILEGKATGPLPVPIDRYTTTSDIPSLNAILDPHYPNFNLDIPDQYRVDVWEQAFKQAETSGNLANLTMMWLPDDHTSGVNSGDPYPTAAVADNDLALGRIVSDISHSQFWKDSAVFVVEDDPQNGVDHVDGHRSVLYLASPYARRGALDSTYYTQVNVVKTIEQILGIPPMNQMDRAAVPITEAFTTHADNTPYSVRPNQIPLDLGVPPAPARRTRLRPPRPRPPPPRPPRFRRRAVRASRRPTPGSTTSGSGGVPTSTSPAAWRWRTPPIRRSSTGSTGTRRPTGAGPTRATPGSSGPTRFPAAIARPPTSAQETDRPEHGSAPAAGPAGGRGCAAASSAAQARPSHSASAEGRPG